MMDTSSPLIGVVAGEASGDFLGAHLMTALKEAYPGIQFVGIGGAQMQSVGMEQLFPMEKLAVRGYVEVLKHYREIVGIRKKIKNYFLLNRPALFIGIDAPDFNLDLESDLKSAGIPTIQYVCPAIWAWRKERIYKIKRSISKMLTIFPFEHSVLARAGIAADYVGHPIADLIPEHPDKSSAREKMKLPQSALVVALLPGSRQSEVKKLADLFVQTAQTLSRHNPEIRFLVPLVSRETRVIFELAIHRNNAFQLPITILFGHAQVAMAASDVVLAASGTATLEAVLMKRPVVITYKMPWLSWAITQRKRYLPYVGLPNILAGEYVTPEILQSEATPTSLSQVLLNLLNDEVIRSRMQLKFIQIHRQLRCNSRQKIIQALSPFLSQYRELSGMEITNRQYETADAYMRS